MGLLIDKRLNFDDELISFLSKAIDVRSGSCVRLLERVSTTGSVTSSRHPIEEINYSVRNQIDEYLNVPPYKSLRKSRDLLPMTKPGKKMLADAAFMKESRYKSDFSKVKILPIAYWRRVTECTQGVPLTYHKRLGPEVLSRLANINLNNLSTEMMLDAGTPNFLNEKEPTPQTTQTGEKLN